MAATLLLDVDGPVPRDLEARVRWALWQVRERCTGYWLRRTRHGWHVGIAVTGRWSPWRLVAMQACLGSDWRREVFNVAKVQRVRNRRAPWNVLYTRKVQVRA